MKLKINPYLGFNDIPLMLVGIPFLGLLIPVVFFNVDLTSENVKLGYFIGSTMYAGVYWIGDRFIFIWMRKRYEGLNNYDRRIWLTIAIVFVYTISFCGIGVLFINPIMHKPDIPELKNITYWDYNIASLMVTATVGAVYEAVYLLYLYKHQLLVSEQLKKENLKSQLETLKNQVNPHFLFNSLNTLSSVIPEDPDLAVEFVQKLSKVYRYILEIKNRELIEVEEELRCIEAYSFLLKIRFGENVRVNIEVPNYVRRKHMVPLSLQMLMENAIKHNVVSQKRPLHITIKSDNSGNLMVSNNLQVKKQEEESTKTGLENINRRYQLLSGKEVQVIMSREHFRVSLPLLEVESI